MLACSSDGGLAAVEHSYHVRAACCMLVSDALLL
jgi:hypothetical protein